MSTNHAYLYGLYKGGFQSGDSRRDDLEGVILGKEPQLSPSKHFNGTMVLYTINDEGGGGGSYKVQSVKNIQGFFRIL